jgi:rare lipoprotein A
MKKIFILWAVIFLAGCANHPIPTTDYAPSQKVDLSAIKNAKPQKISKSRYGNAKSYVVFGKKYNVLNSSRGFDETGIASWYGMKFAGHRTSTREIYDPYEMTAASKTLPLPTFAKVTNLQNGKSVIVKVNDRGPFVGDRLIDLSYVAARKLDIFQNGTGLVRVQAIDSEEGDKNEVKTAKAKQKMIYLQLGAYANEENARRMEMRAREVTKESCRVYPNTLNGRTLYYVRVGPIAKAETSATIVARLASRGLPAPVTSIV